MRSLAGVMEVFCFLVMVLLGTALSHQVGPVRNLMGHERAHIYIYIYNIYIYIYISGVGGMGAALLINVKNRAKKLKSLQSGVKKHLLEIVCLSVPF